MPVALWLRGFGLSASLIIAIGAQNAFVLRQGLRRQHVLIVTLICILSDAIMFTIGAVGFGSLVNANPGLMAAVSWLGAAFLFVYGLLSFRSAWRGNSLDVAPSAQALPRRAAVLTALAVTWLNPHAYLDTIVLAGGIAGQFPWNERIYFLLGTISASFVWFSGLAYGAGFLGPLFQQAWAWRVLDTGVGLLMWWIALTLLRGGL